MLHIVFYKLFFIIFFYTFNNICLPADLSTCLHVYLIIHIFISLYYFTSFCLFLLDIYIDIWRNYFQLYPGGEFCNLAILCATPFKLKLRTHFRQLAHTARYHLLLGVVAWHKPDHITPLYGCFMCNYVDFLKLNFALRQEQTILIASLTWTQKLYFCLFWV